MNKTAIIIPSRLDARRFPNKPLKLINNKEMILHVYDAAVKSKVGDVFVASPDQEIIEIVKKIGGKAIKTSEFHETGTDRIFEVFEKTLKSEPDIIINLQGDMPNIKPESIKHLIDYMKQGKCEIATLASTLLSNEVNEIDVVKVFTKEKIKKLSFAIVSDFDRKITTGHNDFAYHHIGIYGFTKKALIQYVRLKRSKFEIERNLEQMRALENNLKIHVGFLETSPLSVDTEEDLIEVKKLMEKNEKN